MSFRINRVIWLGIYFVSFFTDFSSCVQKWNMHERCGQHLEGYGGEIFFDASKLPYKTATCRVTIVGNGTADGMLSLYFTSFNVSDGCLANITLKEDTEKGLHRSFCKENPYLNEYLIYTTNGRYLSLEFTRKVLDKPVAMVFHIKYVTFVSRVTGCTEQEVEHQNMFSCQTGRCVHKSVVCKDLNPCGDQMDCSEQHVRETATGGLSFLVSLVIIVVLIFVVFAIIQVSLIVKNKHGLCSQHEKKPTFDAVFMPDVGVHKVNTNGLESNSADNKNAVCESLLNREHV